MCQTWYQTTPSNWNIRSKMVRCSHSSNGRQLKVNSLLELKWTWNSSFKSSFISDAICNYDFHLYARQDEDDSTPYEENSKRLQVNIQKRWILFLFNWKIHSNNFGNKLHFQPHELGHFTTQALDFDTEYMLEIHGINANDPSVEGMRCTLEFTTPTCWDIHGNNLDKCRKLNAHQRITKPI